LACKKEGVEKNNNSMIQQNTTAVAKTNSTKTMEQLIQSSANPAGYAFTAQQLRVGYGLLAAIKGSSAIKTELVNYAQQSNEKSINLDAYLQQTPSCLNTIDQILSTLQSGAGSGTNYNEVVALLNYDNEDYTLGIKVLNCSTAVLNQGFYLAIGQEIETDDEALQNHIPAWYIKANGTKSIVLLNESDLTNLIEPVFIISEINNSSFSNSALNLSDIPLWFDENGYNQKVTKETSLTAMDANNGNRLLPNYTINNTTAILSQRFENDNYSEYRATIDASPLAYNSNNIVSSYLGPYSFPIQDFGSIHKSQIGSTVNISGSLYGQDPSILPILHFIIYEYDSYSIRKTTTDNAGVRFEFKAKWSTEWYQRHSNQVVLPGGWPNVYSTRSFAGNGIHNTTRVQ
jgi:hypothetical protein